MTVLHRGQRHAPACVAGTRIRAEQPGQFTCRTATSVANGTADGGTGGGAAFGPAAIAAADNGNGGGIGGSLVGASAGTRAGAGSPRCGSPPPAAPRPSAAGSSRGTRSDIFRAATRRRAVVAAAGDVL